ncbi:MAG: hypothetical protein IT556_08980 [Acetobacteraceae bacterium]|nr:hypothetical protein [Acetobacteraceae bacterium]
MKLKPNSQDLFAGAILLGLALIGLWLNEDHALGSARRMGPGYMPMLSFWLLGIIGAGVLATAMVSGPREVGNDAWREILVSLVSGGALFVMWLALGQPATIPLLAVLLWLAASIALGLWFKSNMMPILAAMAFFWFTLERLGFLVALSGTVLVSALAERPPRIERMLAISLILIPLCYAIFIAFLDIRVPLMPGELDQTFRALATSESPMLSQVLSWVGLLVWIGGIWLCVKVLLLTNNNETTMGVHILIAAAVVVCIAGLVLTELGGKRLTILADLVRLIISPVRMLFGQPS